MTFNTSPIITEDADVAAPDLPQPPPTLRILFVHYATTTCAVCDRQMTVGRWGEVTVDADPSKRLCVFCACHHAPQLARLMFDERSMDAVHWNGNRPRLSLALACLASDGYIVDPATISEAEGSLSIDGDFEAAFDFLRRDIKPGKYGIAILDDCDQLLMTLATSLVEVASDTELLRAVWHSNQRGNDRPWDFQELARAVAIKATAMGMEATSLSNENGRLAMEAVARIIVAESFDRSLFRGQNFERTFAGPNQRDWATVHRLLDHGHRILMRSRWTRSSAPLTSNGGAGEP